MGVFKLGKMTFGSLFKKPETVLYPVEKKEQPEGLKGHIAIHATNCILCGMCERSCPTDCIAVDKAGRTWQIDRFGCVQCGYCVTVCPKDCLKMDPNYAAAATKREPEIVAIPAAEPDKPDSKQETQALLKSQGETAAAAEQATAKLKMAEEETMAEMDAELERKLALLDPEKAEKVKRALARL